MEVTCSRLQREFVPVLGFEMIVLISGPGDRALGCGSGDLGFQLLTCWRLTPLLVSLALPLHV